MSMNHYGKDGGNPAVQPQKNKTRIGDSVLRVSKCKYCSAEIVWVKTPAGKMNCLDAQYIPYRENKKGAALLVSDNGETIRCDLYPDNKVPKGQFPTGMARMAHWATCPGAQQARADKKAKSGGNA